MLTGELRPKSLAPAWGTAAAGGVDLEGDSTTVVGALAIGVDTTLATSSPSLLSLESSRDGLPLIIGPSLRTIVGSGVSVRFRHERMNPCRVPTSSFSLSLQFVFASSRARLHAKTLFDTHYVQIARPLRSNEKHVLPKRKLEWGVRRKEANLGHAPCWVAVSHHRLRIERWSGI